MVIPKEADAKDAIKMEILPLVPVREMVLLPYVLTPLTIGREKSLSGVEAALKTPDKTLLIVTQKNPATNNPTAADLYTVGTKAVIKRMAREPTAVQLLVQGVGRVRITGIESNQAHLQANCTEIIVEQDTSQENEALRRSVLELVGRMLQFSQADRAAQMQTMLGQAEDVMQLVFLLANLLDLTLEQKQSLLETTTNRDALTSIHGHLIREIEILELWHEIDKKTKGEVNREQRDYILRQQMKAIQQELGEDSATQAVVATLREQLEQAELPVKVRQEADRELERLEQLNPAAPDYQLIRTYLEMIGELPWKKSTSDSLDLANAEAVLDADHYGLDDIKQRILEHLAVMQLNPQGQSPILCFIGPPGVGKTSLGQSIARALGRHFERLSLGGMHDEAELRGHRRTYIGAMPGGIIQAIRRAGVNNPVLMLDEIDKLGHGLQGDPAAALLEALDPAQNSNFRDNYLDLPFDLSKVFFITTANTTDSIPRPLLDRMEQIRLAGYTHEEKMQIARRYLIPRQLRNSGLVQLDQGNTEAGIQEPSAEKREENSVEKTNIDENVKAISERLVSDKTLEHLIVYYTREAGVRQLERTIGRIMRKVAMLVTRGSDVNEIEISAGQLKTMLGKQVHRPEISRGVLPAGIATGLAWTEAGGEILYIEAALLPDGRGLKLTGQLGDVMRESAEAAQSYLWSHAKALGLDVEAFQKNGVHLHVPAGAVPKDGPSAGVAMVIALTSLYSGKPTREDTAMTGEITLGGQVLPIGGVKEKVLAARSAGLSRVILPADNAGDLEELPPAVRAQQEFVLVSTIEEAIAAVIPELELRSHKGAVG